MLIEHGGMVYPSDGGSGSGDDSDGEGDEGEGGEGEGDEGNPDSSFSYEDTGRRDPEESKD